MAEPPIEPEELSAIPFSSDYRPLWLGMVFKTNISVGYIRATDPVNHPVAISEKFFEGGINSIRGYSLRSISPTLKIATVSEPNSGI